MTWEELEKLNQRLSVMEKEIADLKRQLEERHKEYLCTCGRLLHYMKAKYCVDCGSKLS